MKNNDAQQNEYNPEEYWSNRYRDIDITKSGHINLPAVYNEWLYRRKKDVLQAALKKVGFNSKGSSVFEIATGTGVYVEMWKQLGIERMAGIDISQAATDLVQKRFPEYSFNKYDVSEPGLETAVGRDFDLVTAIDVLYHVVDNEKFATALDNIAKTIKPGGLFVVHERFLKNNERKFSYIRWRTLDSYVAALQNAGFEVLFRMPTFFISVQPYDLKNKSKEKIANQFWNGVLFPSIQRFPNAAGWFTYRTDSLLGSLRDEGPSFEMMVCRRV